MEAWFATLISEYQSVSDPEWADTAVVLAVFIVVLAIAFTAATMQPHNTTPPPRLRARHGARPPPAGANRARALDTPELQPPVVQRISTSASGSSQIRASLLPQATPTRRHRAGDASVSGGEHTERLVFNSDIERLEHELAVMIKNNAARAADHSLLKKEYAFLKAEHEGLKKKSNESDRVLEGIRNALQCQICLETLDKPWTLNPCGHISCQACLQSWFATQTEGHATRPGRRYEHLVKTCPICREQIIYRPRQAFVLRNVLEALADHAVDAPTMLHADDPWSGIFFRETPAWADQPAYVAGEFEEEEPEQYEFYEEAFGDERWCAECGGNFLVFNGLCESCRGNPDEDVYVYPTWEPPAVLIDRSAVRDYDFTDQDQAYRLLRRGATPAMIRRFEMVYSHTEGIIATMDGWQRLCLGWNLYLDEADFDGSLYISRVEMEYRMFPDRFEARDDPDGAQVITRLVRSELVEPYGDSDSEYYWEM
ncbi:hypothetical protein BOTBODRAFT_171082 [Botryobasidium botryosum FD-172 SS1]|uniref:RING-type domain-containing protein n=1 Tax=Botryobasidium botryosum (strain FD-172 SS1) TaxID=930990 RepID=A0A067N4R7_BOTB1|nr:hypothetical protein BOTBODRAFT_171082 [Botryobasidium botryosum FD-172 SS1]